MLRDAQYFNGRIGRLDGAASLGDYLVQIVAEKKIQTQQRPASPATPSEAPPTLAPSPKADDDVIITEKG